MTPSAVVEGGLGQGPASFIKAADKAGWYTVATVAGPSLLVRGWSGSRRFVAQWIDGKAAGGYWWTREHSGVDRGYVMREHSTVNTTTMRAKHEPELDQVISWTSEKPLPVGVNITTLKALLSETQG